MGQALSILGCDLSDSGTTSYRPVLSANDVRPMISDVITAFRKGKELGRGLTAVVKRAEFRGKDVAIKKIDKTRGFSPVIRRTVRHEVRLLNMLHEKVAGHRHVVEFFGAYENEKSIFLVMELCQGGELFDYIVAKSNFNEADASVLIGQIARGLTALHAFGIIHRDLKPENICLKLAPKDSGFPANSLKIMDFGFSLMHGVGCEGSRPDDMMVVGSPQYMAPEIVRAYLKHASPKYTTKCDIWALGVIMFILLSGRMPFETVDGNVVGSHRAVVKTEPAWTCVSKRSKNAKDLMRRMLERSPSKRISLQDVLKHPWIVDSGETTKAESPRRGPSPTSNAHMARIRGRKRFMKAVVAVSWGVRHEQDRRRRSRERAVSKTRKRLSVHSTLRDIVTVAKVRTLRDSIARQINANGKSHDDDASVDANLFAAAMQQAGEPWTSLDHEGLFNAFDRDRNRTLDWRELVLGILGVLPPSADRLRSCFVLCDADGSGDLTARELTIVLKHAAIGLRDPSVVMRRFRDALECADITLKGKDGQSSLSFDQFSRAIEHDATLYAAFLGHKEKLGGKVVDTMLSPARERRDGDSSSVFKSPDSAKTVTSSEDEDGI